MSEKGADVLGALGMVLAAGLLALLILSTRSCAVDAHHQVTEQVKTCAGIGGTWHDTTVTGYPMEGHCEMKR